MTMSKKLLKKYGVIKYVMAHSAQDALKKEKLTPAESVWVIREENKTEAIGFDVDVPPEDDEE